ncbi:MAG: protein-ADP-ribose hydrolase [Corynebacterium sp.]|nr:protein-ADP-ribose hydrolase [Corynebacterium sp.]
MNRAEEINFLVEYLVNEMPTFRDQVEALPKDEQTQRYLLRALMTVRPPLPLDEEFLRVQDSLLSAETVDKGVVLAADLPEWPGQPGIALWQGDITRLKADAIVDADNDRLLGCFVPGHACIDNAIHSAAGLQLRDECNQIMQAQGHPEPTGSAKLTGGYNLPATHVLHTVGPIISGELRQEDRDLLASCYRSCLEVAAEHNLATVAFCCISTGEFRFPNEEAARIAIRTVKEFLQSPTSVRKVIFNVFKDTDAKIYEELLSTH